MRSAGLMLTIAAVGGFAVPAVFGSIVSHSGYSTAWVFLAVITVATALVGIAGRDRAAEPVASAAPARAASLR